MTLVGYLRYRLRGLDFSRLRGAVVATSQVFRVAIGYSRVFLVLDSPPSGGERFLGEKNRSAT